MANSHPVKMWLSRHTTVPIAAELSKARREKLHTMFHEIDNNESGTIDSQELLAAVSAVELQSVFHGPAQDIFDNEGRNRAGRLSFDQFAALAAIPHDNCNSEVDYLVGGIEKMPLALFTEGYRIRKLVDGYDSEVQKVSAHEKRATKTEKRAAYNRIHGIKEKKQVADLKHLADVVTRATAARHSRRVCNTKWSALGDTVRAVNSLPGAYANAAARDELLRTGRQRFSKRSEGMTSKVAKPKEVQEQERTRALTVGRLVQHHKHGVGRVVDCRGDVRVVTFDAHGGSGETHRYVPTSQLTKLQLIDQATFDAEVVRRRQQAQ